ncbi:MAG: monovalent cation/H+ antiporter complex subunit F, partial [Actinomycetota bacterium]
PARRCLGPAPDGGPPMTAAAIVLFLIAGLCAAFRLLWGPSLADRVMALDVALVSLMGAITVDAARRNDPTNLVMLVVLAIVGFTATVVASRFLETTRKRGEDPS